VKIWEFENLKIKKAEIISSSGRFIFKTSNRFIFKTFL